MLNIGPGNYRSTHEAYFGGEEVVPVMGGVGGMDKLTEGRACPGAEGEGMCCGKET